MPSRTQEIHKEIVLLRDEAARLHGYPNHAALMIEGRAAKTSDAVNKFLGNLRDALLDSGTKELQALTELKKADVECRGGIFDDHFYS
jgi:metallopeptidase MepB